MKSEQLLKTAETYRNKLVEIRQYLHQHPETEFNLTETKAYVKSKLIAMGYEPQDCGKSGITVTVGGKRQGKVFLIRGDMDALPITEKSDVENFRQKTEICTPAVMICIQLCCLVQLNC